MPFKMSWRRLWFPFLAIVVTIGVLWMTNRAVTPRELTWDDVVAEATNGGYLLINTDELRQRYERDSGSVLLVDTRQDWEFAMGHMKGAVNCPMEPTAWSRWQKKGKLAQALGPDKDRFVVFY